MTPQETELVNELFGRLEKLENAPRDSEADRVILDGARQAPHALYALVQTVLVQDEALKRANARIEDLQAKLDAAQKPEQHAGSFLDSMRQTLPGGVQHGSSVPSVRGGVTSPSVALPQSPQPDVPPQMPPGYGASPLRGGSFLGNAASTAAGVVGGALLLDSIRSMFGHHAGTAPSAIGDLAGERASPWSGGSAGNDLAHQAGIDDVGDHVHDATDHAVDADDQPSDTDDGAQSDANDDAFQTADDDSALTDDDFGGGDDFTDV
jgi:uncharacterized protein